LGLQQRKNARNPPEAVCRLTLSKHKANTQLGTVPEAGNAPQGLATTVSIEVVVLVHLVML
jgi:hypothetical protein